MFAMVNSEVVIDCKYSGLNPVSFGWQNCKSGHSYGPKVRTYWILHYVVRGTGIFVKDNVSHQVNPGDIFVIPPYEETYYEADKDHPWRYIWCGFTTEDELPSALYQPVIRYSGAGAVFEDMMRCAKMENGRSAFLSSKLWELMSMLLEKGPPKADYITKALSFMHAEYAGGISVKDVSERLSLDRSYFSTIFSERMGMSPQKYLMNLRMEKAAELMTVYGEKPSTAGASVGYPDIYHFSKMFKKHFGVSPREYKAKVKSEE